MKNIIMNLIFMFILVLIVIPTNCLAMQVFVKIPDSSNITIEVESTDMIEVVKVKIQNELKVQGQEEILPESQILVFAGKELEDGRSLADYNIEKEDIIHLSVKIFNYNVTYNLSNLTSSNLEKAEKGKDYETTLKADSNYKLPDSINVSINGFVTDKYTYDKVTGKIVVLSDIITGDIEVNAVGVEIEEDNPKTFDDITLSILVGTLSLLGSISIGVYLSSKIRV